MEERPVPPFKRSPWRLPAPAQQLRLIVPAVLIVGFLGAAAVLGVATLRSRAAAVLAMQGAPSEASQAFLRQTGGFTIVLGLVIGAVGLAAVAWIWWMSVWIFGPYRRLERDLDDVLYGKLDPARLKVRDGDALFSLVEKVRAALSHGAQGGKPPSGGAPPQDLPPKS
jgi:hypothetical protein